MILQLLSRAGDYPSNSDCAALRAMTGLKDESAVMLFGFFMQLLKLCGAIQILFVFPRRCHWVRFAPSNYRKDFRNYRV